MDANEREHAKAAYDETQRAIARLEAREAALLSMQPNHVRDLQLASTQKFLEKLRQEAEEQESLGWPH